MCGPILDSVVEDRPKSGILPHAAVKKGDQLRSFGIYLFGVHARIIHGTFLRAANNGRGVSSPHASTIILNPSNIMRLPSKGISLSCIFASTRPSSITPALPLSRAARSGQVIQEKTQVSSSYTFTAMGKVVSVPGGTSSPQHSTTLSAPCALNTSGQPSEDQLDDIQKLGVKTIFNLGPHTHENALPDDAASAAALGIKYVHIPVAFDAPSEANFNSFVAAMKSCVGETVHVHCIANMRVSAFFYRYNCGVLGMREAALRMVMDSIWTPGGVWAVFIGDPLNAAQPHGAAPKPLET